MSYSSRRIFGAQRLISQSYNSKAPKGWQRAGHPVLVQRQWHPGPPNRPGCNSNGNCMLIADQPQTILGVSSSTSPPVLPPYLL